MSKVPKKRLQVVITKKQDAMLTEAAYGLSNTRWIYTKSAAGAVHFLEKGFFRPIQQFLKFLSDVLHLHLRCLSINEKVLR